MAAAYRDHVFTQGVASPGPQTFVVDLPVTVVAGDFLIVFSTGTVPTGPVPSGWTAGSGPSAFSPYLGSFWKVADGTEAGGTVTLTHNGSLIGDHPFVAVAASYDPDDQRHSSDHESHNNSPFAFSLFTGFDANQASSVFAGIEEESGADPLVYPILQFGTERDRYDTGSLAFWGIFANWSLVLGDQLNTTASGKFNFSAGGDRGILTDAILRAPHTGSNPGLILRGRKVTARELPYHVHTRMLDGSA